MTTVLLLDSVDEDPTAQGRIAERLQELLQASKGFRQIIITCRTQFFPKGEATSIEKPGKIKVDAFNCALLYLSPFSDEQVEIYLGCLFSNTLMDAAVKLFVHEAGQSATRRGAADNELDALSAHAPDAISLNRGPDGCRHGAVERTHGVSGTR